MPDVDFIARLADAWDGRGRATFGGSDNLALLRLARMGDDLAGVPWEQLSPPARERLVFAARQALDLGRTCAWCFGVRS